MSWAWTAGLALLASASAASAGIIVMKNGNVFRGRIKPEEITETHVRMRWPYKSFRGPEDGLERGYIDFETDRIRWKHDEKDELTDQYFQLYAKEPLDSRFRDALELWREKQRGKEEVTVKNLEPVINFQEGPRLNAIPVEMSHYEIKKPKDWRTITETVKLKDLPADYLGEREMQITAFVAPKSDESVPARIHIVSVPAPQGQTSKQQRWYEDEISKVATTGKVEVREPPQVNPLGASRKDVRMLTFTRSARGPVMALRLIRFRPNRVYFVTCYAHEAEFPELRQLYERCLESMVVYEDVEVK